MNHVECHPQREHHSKNACAPERRDEFASRRQGLQGQHRQGQHCQGQHSHAVPDSAVPDVAVPAAPIIGETRFASRSEEKEKETTRECQKEGKEKQSENESAYCETKGETNEGAKAVDTANVGRGGRSGCSPGMDDKHYLGTRSTNRDWRNKREQLERKQSIEQVAQRSDRHDEVKRVACQKYGQVTAEENESETNPKAFHDNSDVLAVSDTSTVMTKSRKTLHREMQRQKQAEMHANMLGNEKRNVATQCDIISQTTIHNLQQQLANKDLKLLALKGQLASMRRQNGLPSDSSNDSDERSAAESERSESGSCRQEVESEFEEEYNSDDAESSLDNSLEVGDVACIQNLLSERGKALNGCYGKLVSYDSADDRFGVRLSDGSLLSIKSSNLEIGMKADEMSNEDEALLLSLQPTQESIRRLPY